MVDADAFLMKGEELDSHTGWRGNPAKMVRGSAPHDMTTIPAGDTALWQDSFEQRIAAE